MAILPTFSTGDSAADVRATLNNSLSQIKTLPVTARSKKMQRLMAGALFANPVITPAGDESGAASNTIATLTAIGANPTTGYVTYATDDYPTSGQLFRAYCGWKAERDTDFPGQGWTVQAATIPGSRQINSVRFDFLTDAPTFDIWGPLSTLHPIRVLIDGRYVSRAPTFSQRTGGGYYDWFHVVLPNSGLPRVYRRVSVEMNYAQAAFRGIALPSGYVPLPVDASKDYNIVLYGDSLGQATGATFAHNGFAAIAGYALAGINANVTQMALGGTGFIATNGASQNAIGHINDLDNLPNTDEVWVAMGINDTASTSSAITAAALAFLQALRVKLPNAVVVVMGIARGDDADAERKEVAIKAAFDNWADANSGWIPFQTAGTKLFTGNVGTNTPASTFGAQLLGGGDTGSDNTHPSNKGHRHMGSYIAARRQALTI